MMRTMMSILMLALCSQTHGLVKALPIRLLPKATGSAARTSRIFSTASTEVDTGSALQKEALAKFLPHSEGCTFRPTTGGVSNFMSFVQTPSQEYILRIYNNGQNSQRVQYEHVIMNQLPALSFQVPRTLPSLSNAASYELLSSGDMACMFEVIPGALPKLTCTEDIGRACGELNTALSAVQIDMPSQVKNTFFTPF
ncbi:hypothetical protein B484DRAFT_408712 [Ochromonadaceae sp. CCMP2298]|nr:hypothetical protein B484DRAFT_408712 [Ochromonadaceae sp. CCMP2298]